MKKETRGPHTQDVQLMVVWWPGWQCPWSLIRFWAWCGILWGCLLVSVSSSVQFSSVQSLSRVQPILCEPMDLAYQDPLPREFSRQEYWNGLPLPSPGDLPDLRVKPRPPTLQADSLPSEPPGRLWRHSSWPWWAHMPVEGTDTQVKPLSPC